MNMQLESAPLTGATLQEIEAHVQCQLNGRVRDFRLIQKGDGLLLQGFAHTYYAKQLAQHAVMEAIDVPIRANEIEVV